MKRFILLGVLLFEGLSALYGGILLMLAPDGHLLQMPVQVMHDAFPNFLIPGIILTGMGILCLFAFSSVIRKNNSAWFVVSLALIGFTIWFSVEIAILRELNWLHFVSGIPVLVGIWAAIPLVHEDKG